MAPGPASWWRKTPSWQCGPIGQSSACAPRHAHSHPVHIPIPYLTQPVPISTLYHLQLIYIPTPYSALCHTHPGAVPEPTLYPSPSPRHTILNPSPPHSHPISSPTHSHPIPTLILYPSHPCTYPLAVPIPMLYPSPCHTHPHAIPSSNPTPYPHSSCTHPHTVLIPIPYPFPPRPHPLPILIPTPHTSPPIPIPIPTPYPAQHSMAPQQCGRAPRGAQPYGTSADPRSEAAGALPASLRAPRRAAAASCAGGAPNPGSHPQRLRLWRGEPERPCL